MSEPARRWGSIIAGFVCMLVAFGSAGVPEVAADDWAALADAPPDSIPASEWNHLLDHFREKPYSIAEIQPSLDVVAVAAKEGLPVEAVLIRLEEGVVKQADQAVLVRRVRQRLDALRRAREILNDPSAGPLGYRRQQELLPVVASALESRVPVDGMRRALEAGSNLRLCRLKTVVEAGESLKLMGLHDETVSGLMEDFATRNLCCGEVLRAARLAGQQHRAGVPDSQIRELVWRDTQARPPSSADDCPRRSHGRGRGGPR
jgi:hypothetical protein